MGIRTRPELVQQRQTHYTAMGQVLRDGAGLHVQIDEEVQSPKATPAELKAKRDMHYGAMGKVLREAPAEDTAEHPRFADDAASPSGGDTEVAQKRAAHYS